MSKISYIILALICILTSCKPKEIESILDAVPASSFLVVEAKSSQDLISTIAPLAESADVFGEFVKHWYRIDTIISSKEKLKEELTQSRAAMALDFVDSKMGSCVVLLNSNKISINEISNIILDNGLNISELEFVGKKCLVLPDFDSLMLYGRGGFLVFASDDRMLSSVIQQLNGSMRFDAGAEFQRVQSTLGQSMPVHLYLNYNNMDALLKSSVAKKYEGGCVAFSNAFKGIAAFDVLAKTDGWSLNGYSMPTDTVSSLRSLKYQMPVPNTIVNVLPYSTKLMLHYGMSDYLSYWEDFADKERVEAFNRRYKTDVAEQLVRNFSEVAYCLFTSAAYPVFVGRMNDPVAVNQFMKLLGDKAGVVESDAVQGCNVNKLNVKDFIPDVFGRGFAELNGCWYAVVDQYLVVANEFNHVQEVISCYRSGRTLDLSDNFKAFHDNMLETDNICLFVLCADNQNIVNRYVGNELLAFLKRNKSFLQGYQAFSVQMAGAKDLVYTCLNLRTTSQMNEESNVQWKANLDAPLLGKPCIVPDLTTNADQVVVFDVSNNMYLLDCNGNVKWQKSLTEAPMGSVHVVDYYGDGRLQFLFNTANYLELVDSDGQSVSGYPRRMQVEASNPIAVFDYDKDKNYRVLVCGTDRFVYNYNLKCQETPGWNRPRTDEAVKQPVQHLVAGNKDYLIVTDVKGTVLILDRQGRIRIPLKADLHKSLSADIYDNKTNHKGVMLTSEDNGQLLYITQEGNLARTDFGTYTEQHHFLYEDFNGDQDPDFIYLDGKALRVFNRFKKVLYSHDFDDVITTKPFFYPLSRNKRLLGVVSEKTREIYLIDKDGNMMVSSGLPGETEIVIGSLKGNQEINLLTGVGNSLYNYVIY